MTTADDYINSVLERMPRDVPRREQIGTELRSHIAERVSGGQAVDEVLRQLGDPGVLAESYLAEVPLGLPPHGRRIVAKLADLLMMALCMAVLVAPAAGIAVMSDNGAAWFAVVLAVIAGSILAALYTVIAEWRYGQTVGKYLVGLRVVRESGARISLGQSLVRQLPVFLQVYWIDALFALFTDRRQRAFELLSKTRVVAAAE
jgi:uncharacterized RDD family membrane protein YckC